jgi:membrane protease subunit HflC
MLSSERSKIMRNIRDQVNIAVADLGIKVVDFRIRRADLPQKNSEAIFARMISDREKEAKEFRAKGAEAAQLIRARAEKEKLIMLSEARKKAQILRGEGDAKAAEIYAAAHGKDPEFYDFYQSINLYKSCFGQKENSIFILSPESSLLKYLGGNSQRGVS